MAAAVSPVAENPGSISGRTRSIARMAAREYLRGWSTSTRVPWDRCGRPGRAAAPGGAVPVRARRVQLGRSPRAGSRRPSCSRRVPGAAARGDGLRGLPLAAARPDHVSNSVTDERGALFLAEDLTDGIAEPDPSEELEPAKRRWIEVLAEIAAGEIHDVLTMAGIGLYAAERGAGDGILTRSGAEGNRGRMGSRRTPAGPCRRSGQRCRSRSAAAPRTRRRGGPGRRRRPDGTGRGRARR